MKREMVLQWHGERPNPISREQAARVIRKNRALSRQSKLLMTVKRVSRETYIASRLLNVGCCIGRAP